MLVMILPIIYSADLGGGDEIFNQCSTSSFCGGSYDISCNSISDGKCPSHYGDWSDCTGDNYGTYCRPCDPDCRLCENQEISLFVPNVKYVSGINYVNIIADAFGYTGEYRYRLVNVNENGEDIGNPYNVNVNCGEDCPHTYEDVSISGEQDGPCDEYIYQLKFYYPNGSLVGNSVVLDDGMVSPFIGITSPNENAEVQGSVNIQSNAVCNGGTIELVAYHLCDGEGENCETIAYFYDDQESYSYILDTTQEYNGDYIIYADIIGSIEGRYNAEYYSTEPIPFTINNPPGSGISGFKGSRVLNILLARIKTWI